MGIHAEIFAGSPAIARSIAADAAWFDDAARLLHEATLLPDTAVGLGRGGHNGELMTQALHDAATGADLTIVIKPQHAQTIEESIARSVADVFDTRHIMTPARRLPYGDLWVPKIEGRNLKEAFRDTPVPRGHQGLVELQAQQLVENYSLPRSDAVARAEHDTELTYAVDYLLANQDRKPDNLMIDHYRLIDFGHINRTVGDSALLPRMHMSLVDGVAASDAVRSDVLPLGIDVDVFSRHMPDSVLAVVDAAEPDAIRAAHRGASAVQPPAMRSWGQIESAIIDEQFAENVIARRDRLLTTGTIEFSSSNL